MHVPTVPALLAHAAKAADGATSIDWGHLAPASLAALAAIGSLLTALLVYRMQRRRGRGDTLLQIVQRMETARTRGMKERVYHLHAQRESHAGWGRETRDDVDAWMAELDVIALLVEAEQVDLRAFFLIYGDVAIRSIFILAAYANHERSERGGQFLLPLSTLTARLVRIWRREARRGRFPMEMALRYGGRWLDPDAFAGDEHVAAFLRVERRVAPPVSRP